MTINVYREFNTGGADTITISWERRRRTWFTSKCSWFGNFDIPMDFSEFECDKVSYHEDKNYHRGKVYIKREWSFWLTDGVIICSEREERME